jgi:hypothetical protein
MAGEFPQDAGEVPAALVIAEHTPQVQHDPVEPAYFRPGNATRTLVSHNCVLS